MLAHQWVFKILFMVVFFPFLASAESEHDDNEVTNNYLKLQNLIHLQGDQHNAFISTLLTQINNSDYTFLKPAVFANLAVLNINAGNKAKGQEYLADSIQAFNNTSYNKYTNSALYKVSRANLLIGQYAKAIEYTNQLNAFAVEHNGKKMEVRALLNLGLIYAELQLYDLAEIRLNKSLEKASSLGG
jgi:tetratricopeptide (TPR) repeat protein